MTVTQQDYETLVSIKTALTENLLASDPDAAVKFTHNLDLQEARTLEFLKNRFDWAARIKGEHYESNARRLVDYCNAAVPPLVRIFGEAAVQQALPQQARTEAVAGLTEGLGGMNIGALIRKAL